MQFERIKNRKNELVGIAQALGGMVTADVGISFVETNHALGDDIIATPAVLLGFLVAVKGTEKFIRSALDLKSSNE